MRSKSLHLAVALRCKSSAVASCALVCVVAPALARRHGESPATPPYRVSVTHPHVGGLMLQLMSFWGKRPASHVLQQSWWSSRGGCSGYGDAVGRRGGGSGVGDGAVRRGGGTGVGNGGGRRGSGGGVGDGGGSCVGDGGGRRGGGSGVGDGGGRRGSGAGVAGDGGRRLSPRYIAPVMKQ